MRSVLPCQHGVEQDSQTPNVDGGIVALFLQHLHPAHTHTHTHTDRETERQRDRETERSHRGIICTFEVILGICLLGLYTSTYWLCTGILAHLSIWVGTCIGI